MNQVLLLISIVLVITFAKYGVKSRVANRLRNRFDLSDAKAQACALTFNDVAANEVALTSLAQLSDYLKHPEKYERLGARMPRGVLLYGPPGTGKTLLARALAGEAGVPFFALAGSDFVHMYAGVGASRVRALFDRAKKAGKCIIFIDEIDALGKKRDDMSSDERDQTLNALLSEMSGFHPCPGTLVLAATNRLDALDPALLRPGRFDRQIEVSLPGRAERLNIIKLHVKNKPVEHNVDFDALAVQTVSFSGASLESLMNEAAIYAAQRGATHIAQSDIDHAFLIGVAGADRRPIADQKELHVIAVHEAGHALATKLLLPTHRVTRVSILPTGHGMAGYNLSIPPERAMSDKAYLEKQIQVLLAGRAAEILAGGCEQLSSGAVNDLQRATELASAMVMDLGMVLEPCTSLRQLQKSIGSQAGEAMQCARELLKTQYEHATQLLAENIETLMKITEALIKNETLCERALAELTQ